jgi:alkanesulfonate monooxygenase SsuD/methylene tetrahydromethanopterin reductase-like flavin-dependent oxidoreductase (luciferase family)
VIELGVFHNGQTDLEVRTLENGVTIHTGTLEQVHDAYQRILVSQVRQGVLAEELGYDAFYMTEHHFNTEGAEYSPNPLLTQAAVASRTKRIRLGQAANIINWWHPIRFAEQAAMLDVISGGRTEIGIGRGFQTRESEVFGWPYGSTQQDQERNRAYFDEALEVILKAWTEPAFSHRGEFFSIPPSYTKWNHRQTIALFSQEGVGRTLDEVLKLGPPDEYSAGNPVEATTTVLKQISVFPQPVQKPHPQLWIPCFSRRTGTVAAKIGANAYSLIAPTFQAKGLMDRYHEESEKAGWPDRLDRGEWKYGWDGEKRRGVALVRGVHVLSDGPGAKEELARIKHGIELAWDYYGSFAFGIIFLKPEEFGSFDPAKKVTGDQLIDSEVVLVGSKDEIVDKIARMHAELGAEDMNLILEFENPGFTPEEIEEQMHIFAEEITPTLRREFGGGPSLPESPHDYAAAARETSAG